MGNGDGSIEVPIFYGYEDPKTWISWMEKFFSDYDFSEEEKIPFVNGFLEGKAWSWYEFRNNSICYFRSWTEIKEGLLRTFGNEASSQEQISPAAQAQDPSETEMIVSKEKKDIVDGEIKVIVPHENTSRDGEYDLLGSVPAKEKDISQQRETKLEKGELNHCAHQVFEKMIMREKVGMKRRKKKRWKIRIGLGSAQGKKTRLGKGHPIQNRESSHEMVNAKLLVKNNVVKKKLAEWEKHNLKWKFTRTQRSRYKRGRGKLKNSENLKKNKSKIKKNRKSYMSAGFKQKVLRGAAMKRRIKHELVFAKLILKNMTDLRKLAKRKKRKFKYRLNEQREKLKAKSFNGHILKCFMKLSKKKEKLYKSNNIKHDKSVQRMAYVRLSPVYETAKKKLYKREKRKQKHKITWSLPKNHVFILLNFRVKLKYSGNFLVDGYRVIQKKVLRRQQVKNMKICIKTKRNDGQELAKRLLERIIKMKKRAKREKESEVVKSNKYINQLFFVALPLGNQTVKKRLVAGRKPKFKEKPKFNSSEYKSKKQMVAAEAVPFLCRIQVKLNQNTIISPCLMNALENRFVQRVWKFWPAEYKQEEAELIREIIQMTYFKGAASFTSHGIILYYCGPMGNGYAQVLDCCLLHSVDKFQRWMLGAGKQFGVIKASNGDLPISCIITWGGIDGENDSRAGDDCYVVRRHWKTATRVATGMKSFDMVLWLSCLPKEKLGHLNQKHWKGLTDYEFSWDWKGVTHKQSPYLNLEDKVDFKGGGNDTWTKEWARAVRPKRENY